MLLFSRESEETVKCDATRLPVVDIEVLAREIWPDVSVREPAAIFSVPVEQLLAARLEADMEPVVLNAVPPKPRGARGIGDLPGLQSERGKLRPARGDVS